MALSTTSINAAWPYITLNAGKTAKPYKMGDSSGLNLEISLAIEYLNNLVKFKNHIYFWFYRCPQCRAKGAHASFAT